MLEQFGLSNYENKVYMSLLRLGIGDARTISSESEVPYGRIYDTLDMLKNKGVVNEIQGRPKQYTVVEPDIAVENLMEDKKQELKQLENQAQVAKQELGKLYENKPHDKLVWKAAIGEDMYPTYYELLAEARKEFLAYLELPEKEIYDHTYFESYYEIMQKIKSKGVKIKIILGIDDIRILEQITIQEPQILQMLGLGEIRHMPRTKLGFSIIDKEKVILKVVNPVDQDEMLAAIYMWQKPLAQTLYQSFLDMWQEAEPLQLSLITE